MELLILGLLVLGLVAVFNNIISFPMFMLLILLVTGVVWLVDSLVFKKKRTSDTKDPTAVEYAKSFFPIILIVFVIRSFIAEPFKIPSGSMMPTLLAGDFILVNKYTYGLRIPILNDTFYEVKHPARGDVFVFHYPPDPTIDYIKRVVGLPGDKIVYKNKELYINGQKLERKYQADYSYESTGLNQVQALRELENLGGVEHDILIEPNAMPMEYEFEVPAGHYFAMGDNRDRSSDSRFWGFVPEKNLVGKAFFIWFNLDNLSRIGTHIQ